MKFLFQHAKSLLYWNLVYPVQYRRYMTAKRKFERWQSYLDTHGM